MSKKLVFQTLEKKLIGFEKLFNFSWDMIGVGNLSGYFTMINTAFINILGYSEKEILAVPFLKFVYEDDYKKTEKALLAAACGKKKIFIENRYKCKDGSLKWIDWKVFAIKAEDKFFATGRDITEKKLIEEKLEQYSNHLEEMVATRTLELKQKTIKLEEANVALKVLLEQRDADKKEIEKNMLNNVEKLIFPYLEKLKERKFDSEGNIYLDIIESNLKEITSLFSPNIFGQFSKLTPAEIQIVDFIRRGRATKEIAQLLKLSSATIASHRQNIRKKLALTNKKINLRTALTASLK